MSDKKGLKKGLTNYGDLGFSLFLRKAFIKGAGYSDDALDRPIIGITNTASAFNPCHGNVKELIEAVKRGVMLARGIPLDFPTITIHESFANPTSMYLRNLMSMDTEETIRAQPMDAVVLIGGCDKTVPAQLMGAISADLPTIQLVTGAMLTGSYEGERVGACTDCRRLWGEYRAGTMDEQAINHANNQLIASVGTCAVMGTASTMACITEALGMMMPHGASAPAVTADRMRIAEATGRQAVQLTQHPIRPSEILTLPAFENALRVLLAIGGSTNGLVHLNAIAGRLDLDLSQIDLNQLSKQTPVLVNLKPSGQYYMEDFHKAGGLMRLLHELKPLLNLDVMTITGLTLGELLDQNPAPTFNQDIIYTRKKAYFPEGAHVLLHGSLAPKGAVIKQSAASMHLLEHTGRAIVFENTEDLANRIDDPTLDVNADDILVLRCIGPKGGLGMPEAGYIPIPKKLAAQGVRDMVRISDGRISGTVAGTIIAHVSPESVIGGPIGLVQTGDLIHFSISQRRLDLLVSAQELAQRNAQLPSPHPLLPQASRGYKKLFLDEVTQVEHGCDFNFLRAVPLKTEKKTC